MRPASDSRQSFRDAGGQGAIVFDPERLQQVDSSLFDPANPDIDARLVIEEGGRGAAWFVSGPFGEGVLRHYRRGGWMARIGRSRYLWRGEARVRSLREFSLLRRLRDLGLPVPAPIAALYRRRGWQYETALIVARFPQAQSFARLAGESGASAPWDIVGAAIGACHRAGAHHADLNAHNVLIGAGGSVCLIDWDKGRMEPPGEWCERVIARLQRSLRKQCRGLDGAVLAACMERLRAAHDRALHQ